MLGQKEICGLVVALCCSLALSSPINTNDYRCRKRLQERAAELQKAAKEYYSITNNSTAIAAISAELPSCNSKHDIRHIVKIFHNLFQGLNDTMKDAVYIVSLETNLRQQKQCLRHWDMSISSIDTTYQKKDETENKILLVKASENYNCLMEKNLVF